MCDKCYLNHTCEDCRKCNTCGIKVNKAVWDDKEKLCFDCTMKIAFPEKYKIIDNYKP